LRRSTCPGPLANYHQHSAYSDGTGSLEDYVAAALAAGFASMGFSDHAPVSFPTTWTMPMERLPDYRAEIEVLKAKYRGRIEIYAGLEMDYLPGLETFQRQQVLSLGWDYVIGSIHYLGYEPDGHRWSLDLDLETFQRGLYGQYRGDIRRVADGYFATVREMVQAGGPDIVGHFDYAKRFNRQGGFFSEDAAWYRRMVEETLRVIAGRGVMLEVNTSGWRNSTGSAFPSPWVLRRALSLGIPVTVNSDAHDPALLTAGLARGLRLLRGAGYDQVMRLVGGRWSPRPIREDLPDGHGQTPKRP
jgi:histidinol-phosphatase (PHP family)